MKAQCECLRLTNEAFVRDGVNAKLPSVLLMDVSKNQARMTQEIQLLVIRREILRDGKKAPTIFARYCPICGKKYLEEGEDA